MADESDRIALFDTIADKHIYNNDKGKQLNILLKNQSNDICNKNRDYLIVFFVFGRENEEKHIFLREDYRKSQEDNPFQIPSTVQMVIGIYIKEICLMECIQ